jgi:jumonji domain-containing protein 7
MDEPGLASTAIAIEALLTSYHELNTSSVDELTEVPSPLAFMRYVAKNIPFVVRRGASHWPAMLWNIKYLKEVMENTTIEVAITPSGSVDARLLYKTRLMKISNADAVVENPNDSSTYVATPLKVDEPFSDFLDYISAQESGKIASSYVKYAQTRMQVIPTTSRSVCVTAGSRER